MFTLMTKRLQNVHYLLKLFLQTYALRITPSQLWVRQGEIWTMKPACQKKLNQNLLHLMSISSLTFCACCWPTCQHLHRMLMCLSPAMWPTSMLSVAFQDQASPVISTRAQAIQKLVKTVGVPQKDLPPNNLGDDLKCRMAVLAYT